MTTFGENNRGVFETSSNLATATERARNKFYNLATELWTVVFEFKRNALTEQ